MQDLLLEILCWTDRSDAIDALFLCQSGIKGRKAEDEINSAIYSFAFKVMMINNEPKQRNDDEINLIVKWALKCLNTIASSPFFCNQNLQILTGPHQTQHPSSSPPQASPKPIQRTPILSVTISVSFEMVGGSLTE